MVTLFERDWNGKLAVTYWLLFSLNGYPVWKGLKQLNLDHLRSVFRFEWLPCLKGIETLNAIELSSREKVWMVTLYERDRNEWVSWVWNARFCKTASNLNPSWLAVDFGSRALPLPLWTCCWIEENLGAYFPYCHAFVGRIILQANGTAIGLKVKFEG